MHVDIGSALMSDFSLDDIAGSGTSQPDSPWTRYEVDLGAGAPGFALVNQEQVDGMSEDDIRAKILDKLNSSAKTQTKGVVAAQLRSSGIRVHMNM
jgi:hypothetical protein